jgi:3-hydroxyisobutyrate dehydrogenase-like beta-hydroxyacid dehydrogenase
MKTRRIGILHPGEMGISVAASARNSDCEVCWASAGRSARTVERAERFGLTDLGSLDALAAEAEILVSVCPPHAARDTAVEVVASGFKGLYVDANAISPERVVEIGRLMTERGVSFVDGGIIGMPAWKPGATWLYLSGDRAGEVPAYFEAGPLETQVLGPRIGAASALKMCFAALTKGRAALLCGILATAEALGVRDALYEQWDRSGSDFTKADARVLAAAPKAWRFAGEMEEIAQTFGSAGMPEGFHTAAAEIYRRLAGFKDPSGDLEIDDVIAALLQVAHTPEKS